MEEGARALQEELQWTVDRLRDLGGAVVLEDYPGAFEEGDGADIGGDRSQTPAEQERSLALRNLLVERANHLAEARDRLRNGR
jgi:hypothetical protein